MKKAYPKYMKGSLKAIMQGLSGKNKNELDAFAVYLGRTNKPRKIGAVFRILLQFYDVTEKNFYEKPTITERDTFFALLNSSSYTKSYMADVKTYIKLWFRWRWKDLALIEGFPKITATASDKVAESDLISPEEFKALLSSEPSIKWQALISVLYESGCRPEEILKVKWQDVTFLDNGLTDITFYTAKKSSITTRKFPVKASTSYLKELKATSPELKKEDLVFPSPTGYIMTNGGLNFHLKHLAKKCKIEKNIFPYLFRFTRASDFYDGKNNKLDDRNSALLLGHKPSMANTYHKTSNETARIMLIQGVYNIKKLTKEQENKYDKLIAQLKQDNMKLKKDFQQQYHDFKSWIVEGLRTNKIKMPVTMMDEEGRKLYIKNKTKIIL